MSEQKWLECTDPGTMVWSLPEGFGDRRLRLFAVACCWRVRMALADERSWKAIEVSERYADKLAKWTELRMAEALAREVEAEIAQQNSPAGRQSQPYWSDALFAVMPARSAARAAAITATPRRGRRLKEVLFEVPQLTAGAVPDESARYGPERCVQCQLLHCIFGNLFYPVAFDPASQTPNVLAVAQAIYEERRFSDMPILADALEEAGCASDDILSHCRNGQEHVKGCWAVDLVLGKE